MVDVMPCDQQVVGNDPAVTPPPHGLRAHDCGGVFGRHRLQLTQCGGELFGEGVIGIIVKAAILPLGVDLEVDVLAHLASSGESAIV